MNYRDLCVRFVSSSEAGVPRSMPITEYVSDLALRSPPLLPSASFNLDGPHDTDRSHRDQVPRSLIRSFCNRPTAGLSERIVATHRGDIATSTGDHVPRS
jgi:hypothetical protein